MNGRKRRRPWAAILIVAIATIGGLATLVATALPRLRDGRQVPLTEDDRQLLIRAAQLEDYFSGTLIHADAERFSKTKAFSGSTVIEYGYQHPAESPSPELTVTVYEETEVRDAVELFREKSLENLREARRVIGQVKDRTDICNFGEASSYIVNYHDDSTVDAFFVSRHGKIVFVLWLKQGLANVDTALPMILENHVVRFGATVEQPDGTPRNVPRRNW